ncbi:ParB/RepB/Spo0J family partition protein [Thalassotalea marina]|uniref:ParB-like N-terminal domain-containing protein n=1 Tax=Thalassotalea marina TaxID=1673741 RepID=A0A919BQH9_9GAMM|nr:ParB/RepB/Spo0J family partition protein [Thalassotalea marina]GHG07739.1 hypothetical protein GCM10017161_41790 [Thalassotalea marina]
MTTNNATLLDQAMNYSDLPDQYVGQAHPALFDDFKFGNQRKARSDVSFGKLKASIAEKGVIQPVVARPSPDNPYRLELLGGYGRRDACLGLELDHIPFLLRQVDDQLAFEIHLAENLEREDLNIVDKAKAAQEYLTLFAGDYKSTALKLNMTVKAVRELLELNKCTDKVLDALRAEKIAPQHAIVLAPFPATRQDKTLELIINENWTVKYLKERAGKALIPLSFAKFDLADCNGCEHNNNAQFGLFDNVDTTAKCGKSECFRAKQSEWLDSHRIAIEERFGKVLLLSESGEKDRNLVSESIVGQEQFAQCTNCESKVIVMSDSFGKEGMLIENQCIDKICFKKCTAAVKPPEVVKDSSSNTTKEKSPAKATKSKAKAKVSTKLVEQHKSVLRQAANTHFGHHSHFALSLTFASLAYATKYTPTSLSSTSSFKELFIFALTTMDEVAIGEEMKKAVAYFLSTTHEVNGYTNVTDLLVDALSSDKQSAMPTILSAWQPSKDNLNLMTIDQIAQFCRDNQIDAALNKTDPSAFDKTIKQSKSKVIDSVMSADIDFTAVAPSTYLDLIQ